MAETWLNYADVGAALDITPEAARQKAIRGRWRRQLGNDGRAMVLVDVEVEKEGRMPKASANADKRPSHGRPKRPSDTRLIEALQAHIATLQANLAKAEQGLTEVETARSWNDELVAALLSMAERVRLADERRWRLWRWFPVSKRAAG